MGGTEDLKGRAGVEKSGDSELEKIKMKRA